MSSLSLDSEHSVPGNMISGDNTLTDWRYCNVLILILFNLSGEERVTMVALRQELQREETVMFCSSFSAFNKPSQKICFEGNEKQEERLQCRSVEATTFMHKAKPRASKIGHQSWQTVNKIHFSPSVTSNQICPLVPSSQLNCCQRYQF